MEQQQYKEKTDNKVTKTSNSMTVVYYDRLF